MQESWPYFTLGIVVYVLYYLFHANVYSEIVNTGWSLLWAFFAGAAGLAGKEMMSWLLRSIRKKRKK